MLGILVAVRNISEIFLIATVSVMLLSMNLTITSTIFAEVCHDLSKEEELDQPKMTYLCSWCKQEKWKTFKKDKIFWFTNK